MVLNQSWGLNDLYDIPFRNACSFNSTKVSQPSSFSHKHTTCMHSSHLHCALLSFLANAVSNSKFYSQHLSLHNFIVRNGYEVIVTAKDSGRIYESWQSQKMLLIMIVKIL